MSQSDHHKLTVRDWVRQAHTTLEAATGLSIRDTDFTDDRLTIVLRELSKPEYWYAVERDWGQNTVRAYDLSAARVRVDATTISDYHEGSEDGLLQFGNSRDHPELLQVRLMRWMASTRSAPSVPQTPAPMRNLWPKDTSGRACTSPS